MKQKNHIDTDIRTNVTTSIYRKSKNKAGIYHESGLLCQQIGNTGMSAGLAQRVNPVLSLTLLRVFMTSQHIMMTSQRIMMTSQHILMTSQRLIFFYFNTFLGIYCKELKTGYQLIFNQIDTCKRHLSMLTCQSLSIKCLCSHIRHERLENDSFIF